MDQLTKLAVHQAAVDNFNNYAEGIATKNWSLVRSCFSDQVTIDYGEIDHSGEGGTVRDAKDWVEHLRSVNHQQQATQSHSPFRLAVDRSFVVKGAGVVVTGTVHDGALNEGDEVFLFPSGKAARVPACAPRIVPQTGPQAVIDVPSIWPASTPTAYNAATGFWLNLTTA